MNDFDDLFFSGVNNDIFSKDSKVKMIPTK